MVNRRENTGGRPEVPDIEKIEDQIPKPPPAPSQEPVVRETEPQTPVGAAADIASETIRSTAEPARQGLETALGVGGDTRSLDEIMVSGAIAEGDLDTAENLIAISQEQEEPDTQSGQ